MKIALYTVMAMLLSVSGSYAQITLEHSFSNLITPSEMILLSSNGRKISVIENSTNQIKLYNLDYSIWKSINTNPPTGYQLYNVIAVSDNLFNSDNNVECVVIYVNGTQYKASVIDENGNVLKDLGNTYSISVKHADNISYKMFCRAVNGTAGTFDIYSLPGSIPCDNCGNGLGMGKPDNPDKVGISSPVPNPANNAFTISYILPYGTQLAELHIYDLSGRRVMSQQLTSISGNTVINSNAFAAGEYQYFIQTNNAVSDPEKLLIVK